MVLVVVVLLVVLLCGLAGRVVVVTGVAGGGAARVCVFSVAVPPSLSPSVGSIRRLLPLGILLHLPLVPVILLLLRLIQEHVRPDLLRK